MFYSYRNHSFSNECITNGKMDFFDNVSIAAILSGIHLVLHAKLSEVFYKKAK